VKSCVTYGSILEQGNEKFCPNCGTNLSQYQSAEEIPVDCLLPINIGYNEVIEIKIENPTAVGNGRQK
jgi:predicted  nucleic acid-binding Zn-ribbon protein